MEGDDVTREVLVFQVEVWGTDDPLARAATHHQHVVVPLANIPLEVDRHLLLLDVKSRKAAITL